MRFEWDPAKAKSNIRKHGISFDEAVTVFKDPLAFIFDDGTHSEQERREIIIGRSALRKMVLVCFVERLENVIRIISARAARRKEIPLVSLIVTLLPSKCRPKLKAQV